MRLASRDGTLSGGSDPSASPLLTAATPVPRTLPPDDPSLTGCIADWREGFRSLAPLVDRADLIVRAHRVSSATVSLPFGTGYRTTLRVDRALKGTATTIDVLESACPVVNSGTGDWLLFLSPKLDEPAVHQVAGGIQGAFPIAGGRVAPVYRDAYLVRTYTGVDARELERDVASVSPIDADALRRVRSSGWATAMKQRVGTFELPPASTFGESKLPPRYESPFEGYARVAAATGIDLRPYAGREVEELLFWLERIPLTATPPPPVARLLYAGRRFVGGWVQVDASQVFRLDDRAAALAATPRALGAPTPAPNRFPAGVNVVAEYGVRSASSVYVKPLRPGAKPVPAPPLADVLALLDRTLPTEPAPPRATEGYWVVGLEIGGRYLPFEFWPDAGLLVQRDDGYAVHPGDAFARLIGAR